MYKICTKCITKKDATEFTFIKKRNCFTSICKPCKKLYDQKRYNLRKEYFKELGRAYRQFNKEKIVKRDKEYYQANKEDILLLQRDRYKKVKDYHNNWMKSHYNANKAMYLAKDNKRRAKKLQATPLWLTKQHLAEIEEYYTLAKELAWLSEEPLHVDHIVPLQGKNVCGLHVPWNLQILPASDNRSKGNAHG
jgi:hypothetical protein